MGFSDRWDHAVERLFTYEGTNEIWARQITVNIVAAGPQVVSEEEGDTRRDLNKDLFFLNLRIYAVSIMVVAMQT